MTSGKLLDTNAVSALFEQDETLKAALAGIPLLIPAIVVGELYFAAYNSGRVEYNVTRLEKFLEQNQVLDCDTATGKCYGQIKAQLKAKGRPIPENDVWIAALARQHDLSLVTRDGHFAEINGLQHESW